jgi:hypothetical protein
MRSAARLLPVALICLLVAACGGGTSGGSAEATESAPAPVAGQSVPKAPQGSHTFLIVLENRELDEVIGSAELPYLNRLAGEGTVPREYFAQRHPSLPNYLALIGGSTFGIEEDCSSCAASGPNLATQLQAAGRSWRAYIGAMPSPCFQGAEAGLYAKKHNPFMYFPSITSDRARCRRDDLPETRLSTDLARGRLPEFTWITPNLCDDAHSCELESADRYLRGLVPKLRAQLGAHGLIVITFDEGTSDEGCCGADGGRIATILLGPGVRRGARIDGRYTEYALLATLEERFGLSRLRGAKGAPTLAAAFGEG